MTGRATTAAAGGTARLRPARRRGPGACGIGLLVRLVLLGLALGLGAACTTGVVLADKDRGYEGDGTRYLRLRLDTVQLEVFEVPPGQFAVDGALCLRNAPPPQQGTGRALQFRLPFLAWNGERDSWPIRLGMFRLERSVAAAAGATPGPVGDLVAAAADQTVVLVPPRSGAHFDVLVHIAGFGSEDQALEGEYRLTVTTEAGAGQTLLVKNLSVGHFHQLGQLFRFVGFATLALALAGL